jgi:hypothetical protein
LAKESGSGRGHRDVQQVEQEGGVMAIELTFEQFKETQHKIRYEEVAERGDPVVGSLYVSKEALAQMPGTLRYLRVTIEEGNANA